MFNCAIISLASLLYVTSAKYLEGDLITSENWAFLARFCFLSEEGQFEYQFQFRADQGTPNLLLYYDADDQWPAVYKKSKNCWQKESVLRIQQNQIVNLTVGTDLAGCSYHTIASQSSTISNFHTISPTTTPKIRKNYYTVRIPTLKTTTKATTVQPAVETTTDAIFTPNTTEYSDFLTLSSVNDESNETFIEPEFQPEIRKKRSVKPSSASPFGSDSKNVIVTCHNARRFKSSRERWWFLAISNCNGSKGINVKYRILMTNGPPGDYWHEHFSADEFYILPVLMAFSLGYAILVLAIVMCSIELKSRQLLHSTYKLFVLSVVLQLFGIMLVSMACLRYASNGIGAPNTRTFGNVVMGSSEICFLLLLLLLAKGYTVTRGRLPLSASIKLTIFMCAYIVTYLALFVYEAKVFDPGEVLYLYESPAGYGLIVLRIIAWCMFIYSTIFTLKHYPEKANFYYPFNVFGTLWFIAGPAFIISANGYIDKWVRESIVCGVLLFIAFCGHVVFMMLTLPAMANKNFPYHVRTTQIGIAAPADTMAPTSSCNDFPQRMYQPAEEDDVIIPLSRRTEEMLVGGGTNEAGGGDRLQEDDPVMRNVLKWSKAKGVPKFERIIMSNPGSAASRRTNGSFALPALPAYHRRPFDTALDDWVKEVPVGLFTVSRSVSETARQAQLNS